MCVVQRAGIGKNAIEVKKIYRAPDPDPRAGPWGLRDLRMKSKAHLGSFDMAYTQA